MPPESGIFLFIQKPSSEIDAEPEAKGMHLGVGHVKDRQQAIAGEETDVVGSHA